MRISFDMDGVLADMDGALAKLAEQEFGVSAAGGRARLAAADRTAMTPEAGDARAAAGAPGSAIASGPAQPAGAGPAQLLGTGPAPSGPAPSGDELPSAVIGQLSARQQTRLWQRVRDTRNFWESLDECEPGTVRRLQKVAQDLRWDLLFVTQRPTTAGRPAQLQTQHWLRRHGFEYPAVYTTQGSRGRIAAALTLDVHIDDRLENCLDVASESKAWPILVWREAESFTRISSGAARLGIATVRTVGEAIDRIEQAERGAAEQQDSSSLLGRLKRAFGR